MGNEMIKLPSVGVNSQPQNLFTSSSVKTLNKVAQFINEALIRKVNFDKEKIELLQIPIYV